MTCSQLRRQLCAIAGYLRSQTPAPKSSAEFRRAFKTYAASHDLKLNKLLALSFEAYREQNRD
jgi:hypothetical protein